MTNWRCSFLLPFFFLAFHFEGTSQTSGTDFVVTFPQAIESNKLKVLVTLDKANENSNDVEVALLTKDPDEEIVARVTQDEPGSLITIDKSRDNHFPTGNIKDKKYLIRVVATGLVFVVVRNGANSAIDTYLAIPTNQLGQRYYALAYTGRLETAAGFIVIATASKPANVRLKLPLDYLNTIETDYENITYRNNDVIELYLETYEACQFQFPNIDVTGFYIESDEPVAVWSGANRTDNVNYAESHVIEQIPPSNMTGRQFVLFPLSNGDTPDVFRVLNPYLNTEVAVYTSDKTSPTTYTVSRPGSVLVLEFDMKEELSYVEASKPVLVYWITTKNSDGYGDISTLYVPPVDVQMPHSYVSLFDDPSNNYYYNFYFAMEANALDALTINRQPPHATTDFSLTLFSVPGRPTLVGGRLASVKGIAGSYELRQAEGREFVALLNKYKHYDSEGHPLSYGLGFSQQDDDTDDGECCVTVDAEGLSMYDKECSTLISPYMAECCLLNFARYHCQVKSSSSSCSLSSTTRKRSSYSKTVAADNMLDCHTSCIQVDDGCLGVNFNEAGPAAISCELLYGQPLGYDQNDSGSWRHVTCSERVEYILEY